MEKTMVKTQNVQEGNDMKLVARRSLALFMCCMVMCGCIFSASAAETAIVDSTAYQSLFDTLTGQLNVSSIVGVIGAILGVCVGLVFLWWGMRKALSMLMAAFKRGKVSI